MPKDVDDYIPKVGVMINEENVLAMAHLPTTLSLVPPDSELVETTCR
jgi:hypothetical protein